MHTEDWRELIRALLWCAGIVFVVFGIALAMMAWIDRAHGHDWKRPDLDGWYDSLKRPGVSPNFSGGVSCCSKTDCHTTEAELRGDDWWARLGIKQSSGDWQLLDWVKVPADKVLQNQSNQAGEPVICHSWAWRNGTEPNVQGATIWCFIPSTEG